MWRHPITYIDDFQKQIVRLQMKELIDSRKENQRLQTENDILQKALLILGRKWNEDNQQKV